jgi:hypothetical protein
MALSHRGHRAVKVIGRASAILVPEVIVLAKCEVDDQLSAASSITGVNIYGSVLKGRRDT